MHSSYIAHPQHSWTPDRYRVHCTHKQERGHTKNGTLWEELSLSTGSPATQNTQRKNKQKNAVVMGKRVMETIAIEG